MKAIRKLLHIIILGFLLATASGCTFGFENGDPFVEVSGETPSVEVSVETPSVEVSVETPSVEVSVETPSVEVSVETPSVEVSVDEPEPVVSVEEVTYKFRSKKLLNEHYDKHGIEMGFESKDAYVEAANKVINNPDSLHKIEKEDGDDIYYLEETNEFVVVSTDGYIRTYFCPDSGKKYFDKQ